MYYTIVCWLQTHPSTLRCWDWQPVHLLSALSPGSILSTGGASVRLQGKRREKEVSPCLLPVGLVGHLRLPSLRWQQQNVSAAATESNFSNCGITVCLAPSSETKTWPSRGHPHPQRSEGLWDLSPFMGPSSTLLKFHFHLFSLFPQS